MSEEKLCSPKQLSLLAEEKKYSKNISAFA